MESRTRKKNTTSLTQKLRKAIGNINVDVFGYEKNVTRNIHTYFDRISKETDMPKDQIIVRIFKDYGQIRVCVHKEGKRIKEIPVSELVMLFTNTDPLGLPHLQQKAIDGIQSFMMEYCTTHLIHPSNLHICILTSGDQVFVKGINGTREIGAIPLMTLIKHFTK
ncbi:hypothetical protein [uncultured Aquimarina sp.]|uniref:hypothetical protein n=1 Tax=uncultured Aquimarina sp. TaxID=575652 RepID=UPI002617198B|nr:hypothetical protein [uncultured Aquimarina sp.]